LFGGKCGIGAVLRSIRCSGCGTYRFVDVNDRANSFVSETRPTRSRQPRTHTHTYTLVESLLERVSKCVRGIKLLQEIDNALSHLGLAEVGRQQQHPFVQQAQCPTFALPSRNRGRVREEEQCLARVACETTCAQEVPISLLVLLLLPMLQHAVQNLLQDLLARHQARKGKQE